MCAELCESWLSSAFFSIPVHISFDSLPTERQRPRDEEEHFRSCRDRSIELIDASGSAAVIASRHARPHRAATMEALAQAITTLPPDAVDRQRLMQCLGNAERNVNVQKNKEASKWVMQVGASLHKLGGEALPLAERVFQHAVFLAKQLDDGAPEYMQCEFDGNNTELGDAFTWLGATESALGKNVEAENHYRAAAKAVEERGCVEFGDKLLHQAIFFRNRKMKRQYDLVITRWENKVLVAGGVGVDGNKEAHDGREGDVALLNATCSLLQEKSMGLAHLGAMTTNTDESDEQTKEAAALRGQTLAAELRAGRLAECAMRLEAHPLRPAGSMPLEGAGLSHSPHTACAIAHTRPAKGALRPEGRIPSDCYHDCLLVLWSTVFPIPRAMEYSISNPSYYGVQGLPFPIPDIHMAERLTLSFTYRKRCTTSRLRHTTG